MKSPYAFTNTWHAGVSSRWRELLGEYIGRPYVRALEIGSYEGQSAVWMVDNVLTGKGSSIDCFDPWEPYADLPDVDFAAIEARFDANVAACAAPWKVTKHKKVTPVMGCWYEHFDIAYVDGSHEAHQVIADALMAWNAVKVGGVLIFDDYRWNRGPTSKNIPATAIDAFLRCYEGRNAVLEQAEQVVLRRLK